ncbi:MAG: alpha-L-fucosidase [Armatimonadetes bacterium]|nr:alpha-L-fucosidase [Candidatus Hippobium faecium]
MYDTLKTDGDTSWFVKDRFGMFIHWGLYALPARHEWVRNVECITNEEYEKYFKHFDPDLYDPEKWAELAWNAGMKYFVITTKHHEGFCPWDSKMTDYKATNTPYGKDVLTPMVNAFRGQGMKVGFYHSLIDWHHPDFPIDNIHPLRNTPEKEAVEMNKTRDIAKYREYLHAQVKELLTQFGKIDVMWFDFSYPDGDKKLFPYFDGKGHEDWGSAELYKMIRQYQPQVILDDRLDLEGTWDFKSPEQWQPEEWITYKGQKVVWEACQTFSGSWGYHRDEANWKSPRQLITMLADTVSKGGNLLLNVGPTGRGEFDYRAVERLKAIGDWMYYNNQAIYGCTQAPAEFKVANGNILTYNPEKNRLYIHLVNYPVIGTMKLYCDPKQIEYVQFLHDHSEIRLNADNMYGSNGSNDANNGTVLCMPALKPKVEIPVVEVFLKK